MNSANHPIAFVLAVVLSLAACGGSDELAERQAEVAAAGAEVMPFDLDATTHIFTDTETGGIQEVIADDPSDEANVGMIVEHLTEEAAKFSTGDFSDPEAIHGESMPGLATLKDRYEGIDVQLTVGDDGATLTYTSNEPELIAAIHDWFAAQTSDHGSHASN